MNTHTKKITAAIIFTILTLFFCWKIFYKNKKRAGEQIIAILQTATHPALDAVKKGFIDTIKKKYNNQVSFKEYNAHADVTNAHILAEKIKADSQVDGVFAIATPALQAIGKTFTNDNRPIFFGAVSDITTLNLPESLNITGASDKIDITTLVKSIKTILPEVKKIGIIATATEINSVTTAQQMVDELKKVGIEPQLIKVATEADLIPAINSLLSKNDALLAPTDNAVASAAQVISRQALSFKKPFIVSDNTLINLGPFMAQGVDYYQNGSLAGARATAVLFEKIPANSITASPSKNKDLYINKKTAEALNIAIPKNLSRVILI